MRCEPQWNGGGLFDGRAYVQPMSLRPDHKALIFVGAVAVLGAGVRVLRAASSSSGSHAQPALDVQARAADSAASAHRDGHGGRSSGRGRGQGQARGRSSRGERDTTRRSSRDNTRGSGRDSTAKTADGRGPLDRRGYIGGKLDLDVATASQINALPGVTPAMAKRIAADRMMRGPFLSRDGLRRVPGAGPLFLRQIDSLVVFSGTFVAPATSDTVIAPRKSKRSKGDKP
jgi:Helix-hairpin-helix motif